MANTGLRSPTSVNVSLASTGSEYSYELGTGNLPCHGFQIQCRTSNNIRVSYTSGGTANGQPYFTVKAGSVYYEDRAHYIGSIYLRPETNSTVAEIIIWQ